MTTSRTRGRGRWVLACTLGFACACGSSDSVSPAAAPTEPSAAAPPTAASRAVPTSAMPSSLAAPSQEPEPTEEPVAPPRDYAAELRRAIGDPSDCLGFLAPGTPPTTATVDLTLKADGSLDVWNVGGSGVSASAGACIRGKVAALRLPGPIEGAPRVLAINVPLQGSPVPAPPPLPPVQQVDSRPPLPQGFTWGNQAPGVPITGPAGQRITGPAGDRISGPAGEPISGPAGDAPEGPQGIRIGDPSL